MCVIAEKKKTATKHSASLCCRNFYHWWYFNWGGSGPPGPPSGYAYARTFTTKAYRTNVPYQYHNKKCIPYFLAKIEAYRTVPTYRTVLPSLIASIFRYLLSWLMITKNYFVLFFRCWNKYARLALLMCWWLHGRQTELIYSPNE